MLYPLRNKFEMAAHDAQFNYKKPRPAFPNTWPEGVKD